MIHLLAFKRVNLVFQKVRKIKNEFSDCSVQGIIEIEPLMEDPECPFPGEV